LLSSESAVTVQSERVEGLRRTIGHESTERELVRVEE